MIGFHLNALEGLILEAIFTTLTTVTWLLPLLRFAQNRCTVSDYYDTRGGLLGLWLLMLLLGLEV